MARGNRGHPVGHAGRLAASRAPARHNASAGRNLRAAHNGLGGKRLTSHQFAHNHFAARNFHGLYNFNRAGFNRNGFGNPGGWNNWGGQFWGAGWNNWGGGWGGWAGPVFWPFLYGDLFSYAFWPHDYYDPFWAYGSDFILASIFAPGPYFGPDYGYGPDYYDYAGSQNIYYGSGPPPNLTSSDRQTLTQINAAATRSCSGLAPGVSDLPIAQIRQTVHLTEPQAALLEDLNAASNNAAKVVAASCPSQIPLTPVDRLDAAEKRISAMTQVVQIVRTPLETFYDSLSDEQKQQFDKIGAQRGAAVASNNNPQALCGNEANGATSLPVQRIEHVVKPNGQQQRALDGLKAAATKATQDLQASCPTSTPTTPIARLDAAAARLKTVATAMNDIRPALQSFYASLSDEQKARFNTMGPPQSASAAPQNLRAQ
ncbi:MAG TPA: Spy/CpxP family protein refolding chaperone [Xanthobacteraceae bacterium]|nr:Spy/CpxP family protein refolding chaperone [Xanthobacteraceae bacterium]